MCVSWKVDSQGKGKENIRPSIPSSVPQIHQLIVPSCPFEKEEERGRVNPGNSRQYSFSHMVKNKNIVGLLTVCTTRTIAGPVSVSLFILFQEPSTERGT